MTPELTDDNRNGDSRVDRRVSQLGCFTSSARARYIYIYIYIFVQHGGRHTHHRSVR